MLSDKKFPLIVCAALLLYVICDQAFFFSGSGGSVRVGGREKGRKTLLFPSPNCHLSHSPKKRTPDHRLVVWDPVHIKANYHHSTEGPNFMA